jgi:hypothetical protein
LLLRCCLQECLTDFPLAHFGEFQSRLAKANAELELLSGHIKANDNATIDALSKECGADVSFLPSILEELSEHVATVAGNVNAAIELTGCHKISPLLRRLTHGAMCNESVYGLTWIWSCLLAISISAFTMLSTRAALYNSVKTKKKSKRKQKAEEDNEFEDYKEFMADYFPDANEWTKEPVGKKVVTLEIDTGSKIKKDPTFETQSTKPLSTNSHDDLDSPDQDTRNCVFIDEGKDEDSDDDSSYASSSSDESDENDGDSSALSSFFTETVSLARRTIQKIRNLPPLLGGNSNYANESLQNSDIILPESPYRAESQAAYRPSPTISAWITPRDNEVPLYATSRVMLSLTPLAPQKLFNFLSRTTPNEEMEPLTPLRPSPYEIDIAPRKLALSPMISPGPSLPKSPAMTRRISSKAIKSQVGSYKKECLVEPSAPVEPRCVSAKEYISQVGSYKKEISVAPSAPVEPCHAPAILPEPSPQKSPVMTRRISSKAFKSQVGSYKEESLVEPSAPVEPRCVSAKEYRSQVGSYKKEIPVDPSAPVEPCHAPAILPGPSPPKSPAVTRFISSKAFKSQVGSYKQESLVEPSAPVEPRCVPAKEYISQVGSYKKESSVAPSAPVEPRHAPAISPGPSPPKSPAMTRRISSKAFKSQVGSYKKECLVEPSAPVEPRCVSAKEYISQVGSYKKEISVEPSAPVEPRHAPVKGYRSEVHRIVQSFENKTPFQPFPLKSRAAAKGYRNRVRIHEEKAAPSEPSPLKPRVPTKGYRSEAKSSDQEADKSFITAMIQKTVRRFTPERPKNVYNRYDRTDSNDFV